MSGKNALLLLPIATFGLGYWVAPKEQLDREVEQSGFMQMDTKQVLATTVESLREENKMLVFSYKGTAQVSVKRTKLWVFGGTQQLSVPAVVNYYIDLQDLTLADVVFDEKAKIVRVKLPKVTLGDIAFQPEKATTINGGLLTWSQDQVDELQKLNYASARRAMTAQAQGQGMVAAARRRAIINVQSYFAIPLRIVGKPDVMVIATF
ncbi:DUF4230 domain-containing protein [Blastomonas fulva]|jgi:hypothetical protein|uniref:DUF4230 domain-containing protein n=1 Tax=Blastomonas fulva TaxID=1550728 RepID=UPI003D29A8F0